MKKYIALIFILLVTVILGLRIDDPLSPQTKALQVKWQKSADSRAFVYLMGIKAHTEDDPIKVGEEILASIRKGEQAYLNEGKNFDYDDYPTEKELPLPESELLCDIHEEGCFAKIIANLDQIPSLLSEQKVLRQRFQEFFQFDDYATLTYPFLYEPFPNYSYLLKANNLLLLDSIYAANQSNYDYAFSLLETNIKNLRRALAVQDNLIGKMVFVALIAKNIDIAYWISQQAPSEFVFQVEELNPTEKDFSVLMARENLFSYHSMQSMVDMPQEWEDGVVMGWLGKLIYKPNMGINALYPIYQQSIDLVRLSHPAFAEKVTERKDIEIKSSRIRNFGMSLFESLSMESFDTYVARIFDLDAKIQVYNLLIRDAFTENILANSPVTTNALNEKQPIESIKNPYYQTKSAYLSRDNKSICFDGPVETRPYLRCIRIQP